jgi:putative membrane protein
VTVADLPALNTSLNGLAAILLATGFLFIRAGRVAQHRLCMIGALAVSTLFLVSYVVYHARHGSTPYPGTGWMRAVYLAVLASHVLLAMTVPPLALVTAWRALRGDFERHRRIARFTFPIWLYVSVTGVVVYCMLRGAYPGAAP